MPATDVGRGVHDVDAAREVAEHEVAHQRAARWCPGGGWRRRRRRCGRRRSARSSAVSARCSRAASPRARCRWGRCGTSARITPSSNALADLVAGVAEDLRCIRRFSGSTSATNSLDAALAADLGEVLEQQLPDAAALVGVLDQEGDLGLAAVGRESNRPTRDDLARPTSARQRDPVVVVDRGEPLDVALGELRAWGRRSGSTSTRSEHPAVELHERLGVLGPDRAQVRRAAVAQQDVGLPVPG